MQIVHRITPKTFFSVIRGRGSVDETNLVYEQLALPHSDLNQWLSAVEKYAERIFKATSRNQSIETSKASLGAKHV
jgi:hypothetical protein